MKVYTLLQGPGHAWLEVTRGELIALDIVDKISGYSYQLGHKVFLEEDVDAGIFIKAMKLERKQVKEVYSDPCKVRGYAHFIHHKL